MTGGVVLEVSEDQKREKAAALASRLTRTLDPSKVLVTTPFRAAEARVTRIDLLATKEEIRNTLAKESPQSGRRPTGRDPPRSKQSWIRVDTRPGWCSEETGPGWQGRHRMVDSEGRSHRVKTFAMLQVPGDWAHKQDMHL